VRAIITIITVVLAGIQLFAQTSQPESATAQEKTEKVTLKITGMTCAGCSNQIHKALTEKDGIVDNEVKYPGNIAIITYKPGKIKLEEILRTIEKSGYKAKKLKS
jgi:copper chaperone CopZ